MARFYTSFTKSKEAQEALMLLAAGGFLIVRPKRIDTDNVGSRGEYMLSVDTSLGYVGVSERLVYKGAVFMYNTNEMVARAFNELNAGDMK